MEQIFIKDYLGSFARILDLRKTKKGKAPSASWQTASVRAVDTADGRRTIQIRIQGRPPKPVRQAIRIELPIEKLSVVSRFITKVGIEALHFFNQPVLDHRWDPARTYAIDPKAAPFIPYAFRSPTTADLQGFGLVDSPEVLKRCRLSGPAIVATVPGLVLTSPLLPLPEATRALDLLKSEGWSVRSSLRSPKRQTIVLSMRRAQRPQRKPRKRS